MRVDVRHSRGGGRDERRAQSGGGEQEAGKRADQDLIIAGHAGEQPHPDRGERGSRSGDGAGTEAPDASCAGMGADRDHQRHGQEDQPGAQRGVAEDPPQYNEQRKETRQQQAGGGEHHEVARHHRPPSEHPQAHQRHVGRPLDHGEHRREDESGNEWKERARGAPAGVARLDEPVAEQAGGSGDGERSGQVDPTGALGRATGADPGAGTAATTARPTGTFTKNTYSQPGPKVSTPPSRTPTAAPIPPIAAQTPSAR